MHRHEQRKRQEPWSRARPLPGLRSWPYDACVIALRRACHGLQVHEILPDPGRLCQVLAEEQHHQEFLQIKELLRWEEQPHLEAHQLQ